MLNVAGGRGWSWINRVSNRLHLPQPCVPPQRTLDSLIAHSLIELPTPGPSDVRRWRATREAAIQAGVVVQRWLAALPDLGYDLGQAEWAQHHNGLHLKYGDRSFIFMTNRMLKLAAGDEVLRQELATALRRIFQEVGTRESISRGA